MIVFGAVLVEIVARSGIVSRATLLPITEMIANTARLVVSADFYASAVIPTLLATLAAFILASVVGVIAGYVIWRVHPVRRAVDPYLTAYYAIPVFALYPMLIAIWGQGAGPITALAAIFSVVAVIMNAMNGFDSAPTIIAKLAKSMQVNERTYFLKFFFPYALPYILIGLRLAFLYSLLTVLAAEFLLSSWGLGFFIKNAYVRFEMGDMYGAIIFIFILAIAMERLITYLVRKFSWVGALS